jgi:hypothetical protein
MFCPLRVLVSRLSDPRNLSLLYRPLHPLRPLAHRRRRVLASTPRPCSGTAHTTP